MCQNPGQLNRPDGSGLVSVKVPCRSCWQCRQRRLNDYVGRCLCEAATSVKVLTLTLTYAPRMDLADRVLHPKHFQTFIRSLRKSGHSVRYIVAGEYGEEKGRSHFHCILFFAKPLPDRGGAFYNPRHIENPDTSARLDGNVPHKQNCHIREWPYGHVYADHEGGERSIRYVCKYLLKQEGREMWLSMSKKPPLGAEWLAKRAERYREAGVAPSSFNYLPPGADRDRAYFLSGASRRDFLKACGITPDRRPELSEWVGKSFDKQQRAEWQARLDAQTPEELQEAANADLARLNAHQDRARQGNAWRDTVAAEAAIRASGGPVPLSAIEGKANGKKTP